MIVSIEAKDVVKEFGSPPQRILHGLSFTIADGEFVSISGRSGSGKSTLLYILSTLDQPSSGRVLIDGRDPAELSVAELHDFRNRQLGFVFQFHYLLTELTALENVLLPAVKAGEGAKRAERARSLFSEFQLEGKEHKRPGQLSGGEQQRVAIARALIMEPRYIFADEPTGNLDVANGLIVMDILKRAHRERGATVALVTHEPDFAAMAQREIYLVDGRIGARS
ncbi:MAG: ABC transporter ATP-binding protein [Bdellovibrionales bacterium]|nr:ABC transporter ATP-binding protein [Bdellovibrionales bacterium]